MDGGFCFELEASDLQTFFEEAMRNSIKDVEYNGKACYVVSPIFPQEKTHTAFSIEDGFQETKETGKSEVYLEKDTGIMVKTTGNIYIPCEVEYEIGNVKDEVFVEPDLKDYEIIKKSK